MPGSDDEPALLRLCREDVDRLHPWLDATTGHLPDVIGHAMRVALEEVVLNAATHGYPAAEPGEITVEAQPSHNGITLVIEDSGRAFDPTTVPSPKRPASLAEATSGGRGLILLRHYCKHVHYERIEDRNRLTLHFPLHQA
jgi:serine/threonine-protein kinase RsbW